jgi:hypothetical protein
MLLRSGFTFDRSVLHIFTKKMESLQRQEYASTFGRSKSLRWVVYATKSQFDYASVVS